MMVDTISQATERICIVGTPDDTTHRVKTVLSAQGYEVWHASDVQHVCDYVHRVPDIMLIDARMRPDQAGETLERIRATLDLAEASMIVLLAHTPSLALLDRIAAADADYLLEPFGEDEVIGRVALQLRRRRLRQRDQRERARLAQDHAAQYRVIEEQKAQVLCYRRIFECMPIGGIIVSTRNQIEQVNEALCRFLGYDADELIGRQPGFMVLPEDHAATVKPGQQLAEGLIDHFVQDRRRYIRKDGSLVLGKLHVYAIRGDDGSLQAFLACIEDMRDHVQVEVQMGRYTRYQQALAHVSLHLLTITHDAPSRIQVLSQALQQLVDGGHVSRAYVFRNVEDAQYGLSLELIAEAWSAGRQSLRHAPAADRLPRVTYAMLPADHRQRMLAGLPSGGPTRELYADTPELLALVLAESILSTQTVPIHVDGRLWGMLGFDDCTRPRIWDHADLMILTSVALMVGQSLQRWQIEDDLRATSQFLRTTGQLAMVGGWSFDLITRTLTLSDEMCSIFEMAPGTALDLTTLLALFAPEYQSILRDAARVAILDGSSWEVELLLVTPGGRRLWVRTIGQAEQQDGQTVRLHGAMQDVTRRKEAELRLERQLRIEAALAKCSQELLDPVVSEQDQSRVAGAALEHLRTALQIDQAYLMRVVPDAHDPYLTMVAITSVPADAVLTDHPLAHRFPLALLPSDRLRNLAANQILSGPPHPSEATTPDQREWLEDEQMATRLTVPVHIDDTWWGVLGFGGYTPHTWDEQEQAVLRNAAEIFGHALRRWVVENELRHSEEQFRTAVETMLDGFAIYESMRDANGAICDFRCRYINEVGCQLNQHAREEQIGRTWHDLLPIHAQNTVFADYVRLVETGQAISHESVFYEKNDGFGERLMRVFDVRAARLGDGFAVVWRDVTDNRLAHESLTQANEDLLHRVHELRTLNLIAQNLAFTSDLSASLVTVCAAVAERTGATTVVIACYEPQPPNSNNSAGEQVDAERLAGVVALSPDELGPLAGPLLTQRRSIMLERDQYSLLLRQDVLQRLNVADAAYLLLVPLMAPASTIGVLLIGRGANEPAFSMDEQSLAETMASQIAAAITSARFAAQSQKVAMLAERNRVARELHDSATQALYSLALLAGGWATMAGQGRLDSVSEKFQQLEDIALQVLKELRLLIYELRHPDLASQGLIATLEQRLASVEQRSNVRTSLTVSGDLGMLPVAHAEQIFAILQEALNNTLRHAHAHTVALSICAERQQIVFAVQDDGCGFDPANQSGGVGLSSMHERAAQIGASLTLRSEQHQGTLVEILLPLTATGDRAND